MLSLRWNFACSARPLLTLSGQSYEKWAPIREGTGLARRLLAEDVAPSIRGRGTAPLYEEWL